MKKSFSTRLPFALDRDPVKLAFANLCKHTCTPFARQLNLRNDAVLITQLAVDPSNYHSAEDFRVDYLLSSYLSKYKGLKTGIDTKKAAIANFHKGETICSETNRRFRAQRSTFVDPVFHRAQRLIVSVLGAFDLRKLDGGERWGPGASCDLSRSQAQVDTKMVELPLTVTAECVPFFKRAIQADLHWSAILLGSFPEGPYCLLTEQVFKIVAGSNITTVPKNAKTDRTIAIEPRGNMFLQKSVGRFIRRRLKHHGVDLDNQGHNQILAQKAVDLNLATIDLSMASDTIARELVFQLLPLEWALYLDSIRSKFYELEGTIRPFQKFSSMGNGFTFEVESLIFWALTKASMIDEDAPFAIYGDDIILPSIDAWPLITALSFAGFTTNDEKSFISGPFRESCGRHYFDGIDVTPVYQKEIVVDYPSHIRFLNRLKRYAVKHNDGDGLNRAVNSVWKRMYMQIGTCWRPLIPCGIEGDDGYLVCHDDDYVSLTAYNQNYGFKWRTIRRSVGAIPADERALLAYALRLSHDSTEGSFIETEPSYGNVPSRDKSAVSYSIGTRWIEPPWEFALSAR